MCARRLGLLRPIVTAHGCREQRAAAAGARALGGEAAWAVGMACDPRACGDGPAAGRKTGRRASVGTAGSLLIVLRLAVLPPRGGRHGVRLVGMRVGRLLCGRGEGGESAPAATGGGAVGGEGGESATCHGERRALHNNKSNGLRATSPRFCMLGRNRRPRRVGPGARKPGSLGRPLASHWKACCCSSLPAPSCPSPSTTHPSPPP